MVNKRIRFFFSRRGISIMLGHFLQALGTLWLFLEVSSYFFSSLTEVKGRLFYAFIIIALIWTVGRSSPSLNYKKKSKASNVEMEIKTGDLLSESGNIAFGCNDYFDTEPEKVVGSRSIIAQFVRKSFDGDHLSLDRQITDFLDRQEITGIATTETRKSLGKTQRFPIGTIVVIQENERKVFLSAFTRTNPDNTTIVFKEDLWASLSELWTAVRKYGYSEPILIPAWGAGLARFPASRISLIQLAILSFVIATRESIVSRKLTLVISESDYDPEEMAEAIELIDTLEF